ncbi:hypothetical protein CC80DRAFT_488548 [Byssothecium circinans]|uniref:Rhodopsin domain-containing protein n=1 Tax=Byssothecium circinans TaxID=147558 RepID=A0A6A5UB89_9PLEO|nr:hypothetical protein CC80DRAFT_488548 [Byssothecium circinans]
MSHQSNLQLGSYTAAIGGIAALLGLDVLVVGTRFYVRKSLNYKLSLNDWLTIPALLLNIGMATAMFYGVGKDFMFSRTVTQLPGPELVGKILKAYSTIKQIEFAVILMSLTALALIKVSFLLFYKLVFVYDKWRFFDPRNMLMNLLIATIIIWDIGFSLTLILSCRGKSGRVSTYWDTKTSKELTSKCINPFVYMYALSISDFITDAIIILIPIPMVWKLHLPTRRKFGVSLIFLLGSLAALASLIRLIWMADMMAIGTNPSKHPDPLTMLSNELFWYVIESELALLAVCLPALSGLRRTRPVNNIVRSVQSKLSLRSSGSDRGGRPYEKGETPRSSHSHEKRSAAAEGGAGHVDVLPDLESQVS